MDNYTTKRRNTQQTAKQKKLATSPLQLTFASPKLSELQYFQAYKLIKKPKLNLQKLKSIKDQLMIDQNSKRGLQRRLFENNLLFSYDYNPMTSEFILPKDTSNSKPKPLTNRDHSINDQYSIQELTPRNRSNKKAKQHKMSSKLTNIIDQLQKFKNKKTVIKRNIGKQFTAMLKEKQKISYNLSSSPNKVIIPEQSRELPDKSKLFLNSVINHVIPQTENFDFDRIVNIKQESYFAKNNKIDNIFQILFKKKQDIFNTNSQLDKYYFCHNSIKQKIQKFKIPIYRDVSKLARDLVKKIPPRQSKMDYLMIDQFILRQDEILLNSLLSVASGRLDYHDVTHMLLEQLGVQINHKKKNDSDVQEQEKEIYYANKTQNAQILKENVGEENREVQQFLKIPIGKKQLKYKNKVGSHIKSYLKTLDQQQYLKQLGIKDQRLLNKINKIKQQQINYLFRVQDHKKGSIDRQIRMNKKQKNKNGIIHIRSMIQTNQRSNSHKTKMSGRQRLTPPRFDSVWK